MPNSVSTRTSGIRIDQREKSRDVRIERLPSLHRSRPSRKRLCWKKHWSTDSFVRRFETHRALVWEEKVQLNRANSWRSPTCKQHRHAVATRQWASQSSSSFSVRSSHMFWNGHYSIGWSVSSTTSQSAVESSRRERPKLIENDSEGRANDGLSVTSLLRTLTTAAKPTRKNTSKCFIELRQDRQGFKSSIAVFWQKGETATTSHRNRCRVGLVWDENPIGWCGTATEEIYSEQQWENWCLETTGFIPISPVEKCGIPHRCH